MVVAILLVAAKCTPTTETNQQDVIEEVVSKAQVADSVESSWEKVVITKLELNGNYPQFTNDGNSVVYTTSTYDGLWLYNLKTKSIKQLTDKKGAGYKPKILSDTVIYQVRARMKYLEQVEISTGTITSIINEQSRLMPEEFASQQLTSVDDKIYIKAASDLFSIEIFKNDSMRRIAPLGKKNYLNLSLSPNQQLILFEVAGLGGYIVNLSGNIVVELGDMDNPSWIGNEQILYAISKDDGEQTLSSEIYVRDIISSQEYHLSADIKGQLVNPRASETGAKVIVSSPDGEVFLITKVK